MKRRNLIGVGMAAVVLLSTPTLAEALGEVQQPFTVSADPGTPSAHGTVTLTPVSGDIDITAATMTVSVNGTQSYTGNAVPVEVALGAAGVTATIVVSMKTTLGTYRQTLSLTPQDVTLVAEPLASAPPFYPGRPLVPLGGSVRVVALADLRTGVGVQLNPTTLSYAWTVDGAEAVSGSGIGERVLIVDSPLQYRARTVEVVVTSPDGLRVGTASLDLVASDPTMRIYERDPLMGIRFDRALGDTYALSGSEASLYGAPFSFPTALRAPTLSWYVGGTLSQTGNLITLRPTGRGAGTTEVSVTGAASGSLEAPAASASLTVSFGSTGGGGLFGL